MKGTNTTENSERSRRHITINDQLYIKVGQEAIAKGVDYGAIVDKALKAYFDKK